jgi:hypothetical protein
VGRQATRGAYHPEFFQSPGGGALWCRQLVLGPAPEVAIVSAQRSETRVRIA